MALGTYLQMGIKQISESSKKRNKDYLTTNLEDRRYFAKARGKPRSRRLFQALAWGRCQLFKGELRSVDLFGSQQTFQGQAQRNGARRYLQTVGKEEPERYETNYARLKMKEVLN